MTDGAAPRLKPEVRGWLRHLWRKAMTRDDWSRWVEDVFRKRYMGFDGRGNLRWVALYYDPILDDSRGSSSSGAPGQPVRAFMGACPRGR